jgi:hypothetical protein
MFTRHQIAVDSHPSGPEVAQSVSSFLPRQSPTLQLLFASAQFRVFTNSLCSIFNKLSQHFNPLLRYHLHSINPRILAINRRHMVFLGSIVVGNSCISVASSFVWVHRPPLWQRKNCIGTAPGHVKKTLLRESCGRPCFCLRVGAL